MGNIPRNPIFFATAAIGAAPLDLQLGELLGGSVETTVDGDTKFVGALVILLYLG